MSGKQAIQRIKDMVERCKYSTMKKVSYVALQCENGVSVKMENCNTIWKWWVTENQQPKLQQIKHKKKPCERRKKCLIQKAG